MGSQRVFSLKKVRSAIGKTMTSSQWGSFLPSVFFFQTILVKRLFKFIRNFEPLLARVPVPVDGLTIIDGIMNGDVPLESNTFSMVGGLFIGTIQSIPIH